MSLSHDLYELCEEFCALISYQRTKGLKGKVDSLLEFLEDSEAGLTYSVQDNIAFDVEKMVEEIWELIPQENLEEEPDLDYLHDQILERINRQYEPEGRPDFYGVPDDCSETYFRQANKYDFEEDDHEEEE
jgi:hypothetical protein